MTLYWVDGRGVVDDSEEGAQVPWGAQTLGTYANPADRYADPFTWDPGHQVSRGEASTSPDFLGWLMSWRTRTPTGNNPGEVALAEMEQDTWRQAEAAARAIPTRDISTLTAGWADDGRTDDIEGMPERWWTSLHPASPDAAPILLALRDKLAAGTATGQERALYEQTMALAGDWSARASRPDPWSPLGDQLFGALGTLALGATGGLAGGALAAGGGLASTLGSLGTLSGVAGTGAGVLGQEMDMDWLRNVGLGLGAAGGIAGGVGGLANLASTGVPSLGDAARLASSAGRVVGGVGAIADNDALTQAGGWLGTAGQLGGGVENLMNLVGGAGGSMQGLAGLARPLQRLTGQFMQPGRRPTAQPPMARPDQQAAPQPPPYSAPATRTAPTMSTSGGAGGILALLQAAQQAQRQGMRGPVPQTMSGLDWLSMRGQQPQPQSTLWNL